jgi:predicted  nucleic acid-binding Zn-ribbon protein
MNTNVIIIFSFKVGHFTRQRRKLEEKISRKENELQTARHELNEVQESRKKKAQMQKELEDVILSIVIYLYFIFYFID